jgi:hypothetical protein
MRIITAVVAVFLSACASTAPYTPPPQLERELGGIEIGKDFTPLSKDVDNALKIDMKGNKSPSDWLNDYR